MPTKIVTTKSNPAFGEINQNDYKRIIQDFENFVQIESTISRTFKKIRVISIPAIILQNLLDVAKKKIDQDLRDTNINLKFGITLPDQKDCINETIDVSNHLTIACVIEKVIKSSTSSTANMYIELDEPNSDPTDPDKDNFIIVPGFREFIEQPITDRLCCPVIKPGS